MRLTLPGKVLGVALLASAASAGDAPSGPPAAGRAYGIGLGLGSGSMSVGDDRQSTFGASVLGRIGLDSRNRFLAVAEVNPLAVGSPVADEAFRAVNVLVAVSLGNRFKVRPSVGWQFRFWSGSQQVESSDSGPLIGLEAGPEFRVGPGLTLSPEFVFRASMVELEGSVGSQFIGVQLVASWAGARSRAGTPP